MSLEVIAPVVGLLVFVGITIARLRPFLDDGFDELEVDSFAIAGIIFASFVIVCPCVSFLAIFDEDVSSEFNLCFKGSLFALFGSFLGCVVVGSLAIRKANSDLKPFNVLELPDNDFETGVSLTILGAFVVCCDGNNVKELKCDIDPVAPCFEDEERILNIIKKIGDKDSSLCSLLKGKN